MSLSTIFHVVSRVQDVVLSLWLCHMQGNFHARACGTSNQLGCVPTSYALRARPLKKVIDAYGIVATRNRGITKYRKLSSLDYLAVVERLIPSFAIRDRSVFGLMPSWVAAPCSPEMTQLVFSSIDSI